MDTWREKEARLWHGNSAHTMSDPEKGIGTLLALTYSLLRSGAKFEAATALWRASGWGLEVSVAE